MSNDQKRIHDALDHWRNERDRVFIEIQGYETGVLRMRRQSTEGWVDISAEQTRTLKAGFHHLIDIIAFFEGMIAH